LTTRADDENNGGTSIRQILILLIFVTGTWL